MTPAVLAITVAFGLVVVVATVDGDAERLISGVRKREVWRRHEVAVVGESGWFRGLR